MSNQKPSTPRKLTPEQKQAALEELKALPKGTLPDEVLLVLQIHLDRDGGPRPCSGETVCPVCGNVVTYSIASNDHVWAKCRTKDCLHVMQ